jgi:hypothetical protein
MDDRSFGNANRRLTELAAAQLRRGCAVGATDGPVEMWKSTKRIPTFPQGILVREKCFAEIFIRPIDLTGNSRFIEGTENTRDLASVWLLN